MSQQNEDINHRFGLGQAVWLKNGKDCRGWVIHNYFQYGVFGEWAVCIAPENDKFNLEHWAWEDELTDQPVQVGFHKEHSGFYFFTGTGRPLKMIKNMFDT